MITTTTNYTINTIPTKKEIVEKLFKAGQITLDEVLELMKEPAVNIQPITPQYPWNPFQPMYKGGDAWTVSDSSAGYITPINSVAAETNTKVSY